MRSTDPDEQARVDSTLKLLDAQLAQAPIAKPTADLLFLTASQTLLLRQPTDLVGWLLVWHGEATCAHVTGPDLVWRLMSDSHGRLAYLLDLDQLWRQGAGDTHLLAEAAARAAAKDPTPEPTPWPKEPA